MSLADCVRIIILGLWFTSCALADTFEQVVTFPVNNGVLERRDAKGLASVVYGCSVANEFGPCVDTPSLCTSQGGKLVGYCFFNGKYEGICCSGLNPANSTLTTKPPHGPADSSTVPTETPPTQPSMTPPTAPTTQTMTPPTAPTTQTMTPPTAPSMPTQTMTPPTAPSMSTETMTPPTAPSMPTQTMTPPTAPSMSTQTMTPPTTQSMPTQTMTPPTAPSMPTQTMTPPTTQTMTPPTTQSMPTQTMTPPTAPSMPTQTMTPPTTQTMTPPTTQSMPTQTMTPPTTPTAPSTPSFPTAPTLPSITQPGVHDGSNPWPTFGTVPALNLTTQTMPNLTMTTQAMPNLTMTTQAMPNLTMTTQAMPNLTMTTQAMPNLTMTTQAMPNLTMTTQAMPNLTMTTQAMPNFTMTTEAMPNFTMTESFPNFTTTTSATTTTTTTVPTTTVSTTAPPPPADVPSSCSEIVTADIQSNFQNPSYPSLDTDADVYQYVVVPQEGYCALRIEILEAILAGKGVEGCTSDSIKIIGSDESPTTPVCGLLQGFEWTVNQLQDQPIKIVVTTQSSAYLWNFNITQIECSTIKPYEAYESPNCGVKNSKPPPAGIFMNYPPRAEEPRSVSPVKLIRTKKKALREIMSPPSVPLRLLQNAVLNRESSVKIVRGNETGVNEWPWQALLMVNGQPYCGGSLLNEEWVVTAGHCVHLNLRYPLVSVLTIDLGDHDLRTGKETKNLVVRVSKILPHVQYEVFHNDIALIKLASKVHFGKTIRPVCLPPSASPPNTYADRTGVTTGWGKTEDVIISPVLREASVPVISNQVCRQQWASTGEGSSDLIRSDNVCAGGTDVGPCNGDSGGPLVVEEEGKWRLVGLTSFGLLKGCGVPGVATVFTRVTSYLDWLGLSLTSY